MHALVVDTKCVFHKNITIQSGRNNYSISTIH